MNRTWRIVATACGVWAAAGQAQVATNAIPAQPLEVVRYDGHKVVRVQVRDHRQFLAVTALADSVWTHSPGIGPLDVQLSPAKVAALEQLKAEMGMTSAVMIEDLQAAIDRERAEIEALRRRDDITWFGNFKTYAEVNDRLLHYHNTYPALAQRFVVGNSLESRTVYGVVFSAPDLPGNLAADRPQVFFSGCQHAREWATPMTTMWIVDNLIEKYGTDARLTELMKRVQFIVVPIVNPDGYVYSWGPDRMWRKNRRPNTGGSFGVDPNRNWGYQWGGEGASTTPTSETFRGTGPFSEPETQIVRDMVLANPRIRAHIDFHSYSQLVLEPWGYTSALPPDSAAFASISARMVSAIAASYGKVYTAGPSYTTIYPASGVMPDWMYGDRLGGPLPTLWSWTIEVRDTGSYGFIMPTSEIVPNAIENFNAALALAETIAYPLSFGFPSGLPGTVTSGAATDVPVTVAANPGGSLNPTSPALYARVGTSGAFSTIPLTPLGGSSYRATLPPAPCGSVIEYYFGATPTSGAAVFSPVDAPATVYTTAATQVQTLYFDPCEGNPAAPNNWTIVTTPVNASNPVSGIWENADPQGTAAQPENSYSPTRCWITDGRAGTGVGSFDVDNCTTVLTSPVFNAVGSGGGDAYLSYARWFSNNQGSNPNTQTMPIEISNDGGTTWTQLELVNQNAGAWVVKSFRIADFLTPSATMRVRFSARDLIGAIVEAGVDEVKVTITGCPAPTCCVDYNGDEEIDFSDVEGFLAAYAAQTPGNCAPGADLNGDEEFDFSDIETFVSLYNAGC